MTKRNRLIAKIIQQYDQGIEIPLIELDDFFDGNFVEYSIAQIKWATGILA